MMEGFRRHGRQRITEEGEKRLARSRSRQADEGVLRRTWLSLAELLLSRARRRFTKQFQLTLGTRKVRESNSKPAKRAHRDDSSESLCIQRKTVPKQCHVVCGVLHAPTNHSFTCRF